MARSATSRPGRSLGTLVGLIAVLFGVIGSGVVWSNAQWTPKLGLDLEGGWEIVMTAVPQPGGTGTIDQNTMDEAVKIIRQRINGAGVSEAEITTQGAKNIVVSIPGKNPDQATINSVKQAAALEFRAVLVEQASAAPPVTASPTASGTPGATASPGASASAAPSSSATATLKAGTPAASAAPSASAAAAPSASKSANGMVIPAGLLADTPAPSASAGAASPAGPAAATPTGAASPGASAAGSATAKAPGSPAATPSPTSPSDMAWINQEIATQFEALDCTKAENRKGISSSDPKKPLVTCTQDGAAKYILGPTELTGKDLSGATFGLEVNAQGQPGINYEVDMTFKDEGAKKFATVTQRLVGLQGSQNQFAIVLDGLVVSAPRTEAVINTGSARITGNFNQLTAQTLANQLKFGALPISFEQQTSQNITATLGSEQLRRGLLAGLIGLGLVVVYSLLQYRALGLVTVASLTIAAVVTYGLVVLLGWRQGYRLSLPGVAGLIVSIGITADSFIVYFERVRDEVRDGRGLLAAVDTAWLRARRTILISDAVSFLAAAVLYVLAVGGVKGFAFTLGLTTIVDILIVFLFTHPTVALLARTRFFGGGHKLSGFDAEHLGRAVAYTGRAGVRSQPRRGTRPQTRRQQSESGLDTDEPEVVRTGMTIAERRAAEEKARREALRSEPGGGNTDPDPEAGPGSPSGRTLQTESAGDSRRRDA